MNVILCVSLLCVGFLFIVLIIQQSHPADNNINNSFKDTYGDYENENYYGANIPTDPYPFSYILNPNETICEPHKPGNNLTILAFIPSSVHDYHMRMILRSTWTNYLFLDWQKIKYVFMVGFSTNETVNQMVIQIEFKRFISSVYSWRT
jgi:hypothetical protein